MSVAGVGDCDLDAAITLARTSTPPDGAERWLRELFFGCDEGFGDVDLSRLSGTASAFALISP